METKLRENEFKLVDTRRLCPVIKKKKKKKHARTSLWQNVVGKRKSQTSQTRNCDDKKENLR